MDSEYINTFRWLRDDYTRLRDGTELFERVNERYANANYDDSGSCATQQDLNNLRSSDHDCSINSKSAGSCSNAHSVDSIIASQSSSTVWPTNGTKQNEPRRPRKGHKKSRRGCYNCKKRKVKVWFSPDNMKSMFVNYSSVKKLCLHVKIVHEINCHAATLHFHLQYYP